MLASHLVRTDRHLLPHVWAGGLSTPAFDVSDASTCYATPLRGVPSFAPRSLTHPPPPPS
ncbi:hypothetical protein N5P18_12545 [Janibacter terrae]|uniref:Uncharacterized protein n=1 Tax=Janibacter terrae TaxID=103817 RepID=A0ABZ2FBE6_9MICO